MDYINLCGGSANGSRRGPLPGIASITYNPAMADKPYRMIFTIDKDDAQRVRDAYAGTRGVRSGETLSEFIAALLLDGVEQLEQQHHGGQPWPPARSSVVRALAQKIGS